MKGSSKKSARRKSKEGLGVNFDWRRRAHSNWRRLKEGWLKVGVNLSQDLWQRPRDIKTQRYIWIAVVRQKLVIVIGSYLGGLFATRETLRNSYVMEQLRNSEEDIQKGRVRSVTEFIKDL